MGRAEYLIAKYVPDLFRNEPINIGVVAWLDGQVGSRFLGEKTTGAIDLRSVPSQITSRSNYRQWVSTWKKMLDMDSVKVIGTSQLIEKANRNFLTAIQSSGRGNYVLEPGGQIMEEVIGSELPNIVDFLFERLVEDQSDEQQNQSAKVIRDEFLAEANLKSDPRIKIDKNVPCKVGKKEFNHEFHLWVGNGEPAALAQVLTLTAKPRDIKSKADAFFMRFQSAQNTYDHEIKFYAMYYSPEEKDDDLISDALGELGEIATLINLGADRERAIQEIRKEAESIHL